MAVLGVAQVVDVLDELASLFLILFYASSLLVMPLASFVDPHPQLLIDFSLRPDILWCWSLSCIFFKLTLIFRETPCIIR